ncbi:MAG: hypothetical protein ACTS3F_12460, partial [Phycisphaerales bacterium]
IVLAWAFIWWHRRRWIAYAALVAGLIPIAIFTSVCIEFLHLKQNEPPPSWLYLVAALYAFIFLLGGFVIAAANPHRAQHPCHHCGYDLLGLSAPTPCPECGTPIRAEIPGIRRSTEDELRPDRLRTPARDDPAKRVREFITARREARTRRSLRPRRRTTRQH